MKRSTLTLQARLKRKARVLAPPSKSAVHRWLFAGLLTATPFELVGVTLSRDILATLRVCQALGAKLTLTDEKGETIPLSVLARHLKDEGVEDASTVFTHVTVSMTGVGANPPSVSTPIVLDCDESGTTARFLLGIAPSLGVPVTVTGAPGLCARPMGVMVKLLREAGCRVEGDDTLPLTISGRLKSGDFFPDGSFSSQFTSGLLMGLGVRTTPSTLYLGDNVTSRPYVDMTLEVLRRVGVTVEDLPGNAIKVHVQAPACPVRVTPEGDWSQAAFWGVAAALTPGSDLTIAGLSPTTQQGDQALVSILKAFGATVTEHDDAITIAGAALESRTPLTVNAKGIPDLVPVLSLLGAQAPGTSIYQDVGRLRHKESDRLAGTIEMLTKLGVKAWVDTERDATGRTLEHLVVEGKVSTPFPEATIAALNDHRFVMSAAVAALVADGPITVTDPDAVTKSYPDFFTVFSNLTTPVSFTNEEPS